MPQWKRQGGIWRGISTPTFTADILVEPPPPPPDEETAAPFVASNGVRVANVGPIEPPWGVHQTFDIGIMFVETAAQALGTVPSGWAHIAGSPFIVGSPGTGVWLHILWKRATSSAELALSIGDSGDHQVARITVVRGAIRTGNPVNVIGSNAVGAAQTAVSIAGATTTVDKCLVLASVANGTDTTTAQVVAGSWANSSLTAFSEVFQENTGTGNGGGFSVVRGVKDQQGVYSATTATLVTSSIQICVSFAIKPEPGTAPPPPPPGDFRTAIGAWGNLDSEWGLPPSPDSVFSDSGGTNLVNTGGYIDDAIATGSQFFIRVYGGNQNVKNPDGSFSPTIYNSRIDTWADQVEAVVGGLTKMRSAVATGHLRGLMVLDDFTSGGTEHNAFLRSVIYSEIETITEHMKERYLWLPLGARGTGTQLLTIASAGGVARQYHWLDAAWAQWAPSFHGADAVAWFAQQVQGARSCGLGLIGGCNMSQRGRGDTPGWGCIDGSSRAGLCGMSPAEIERGGMAVIANGGVVGYFVWSRGFDANTLAYYNRPEILVALNNVYNAGQGRTDPALHIRNDGSLEAA